MIRSRLSRLAPALATGLLLAAPAHAATKPDAPRAATAMRTFKPVSATGSTLLFRVAALAPERVVRARLFAGGHAYEVKVSIVRTALRRKGLIRTRLTAAVAARVRRARRHKPTYRSAHLTVYLRKVAPKKKATTPARPKTSATAPKSATTTAGPSTKKSSSVPPVSFPCGGTWGQFSETSIPGACWRPYGDASPFNRALPANPRLAADSQSMVDTMTGWGAPEEPYVGAADTSDDWNHPYYFSRPTDPTFTVHCTRSWGTCAVEGMQVHIPDAARAAGGGDGHMAIIDQLGGWEYDFWQVASKPHGGGTLTISWGGRTHIGTSDADGLGTDATAALFGLVAGVIRYPEMAAGHIDHALFLIIKCSRGKVYPAQGLGSDCADGHAPAMGQHLYLDMSDGEIAGLDAPAWQKTILTAMAHYGMFVGDTGGSPWGVEFESGSTYTSFGQADPWVGWAKQQPDETDWHGHQYLPRISGVDWNSRLKVVDPCVDQGSC